MSWPNDDLVASDSLMALEARIEAIAASEPDSDDIQMGMVVSATGLGVYVQTEHPYPMNLVNHYSSSPIGRISSAFVLFFRSATSLPSTKSLVGRILARLTPSRNGESLRISKSAR